MYIGLGTVLDPGRHHRVQDDAGTQDLTADRPAPGTARGRDLRPQHHREEHPWKSGVAIVRERQVIRLAHGHHRGPTNSAP